MSKPHYAKGKGGGGGDWDCDVVLQKKKKIVTPKISTKHPQRVN